MYNVTTVARGLVLMAILFVTMTSMVLADGNETLGPPSISIAAGSGHVTAGIGLAQSQPGIINLNVPAGATINQVLIYWEGQHTTPSGDDAITVAGNGVTGTLIGGPNYFFDANAITPTYSSTYRADITSLGLVAAGANAISVGDMSNDLVNDGAGIVVIYSDGLPNNELQLFDGNDLAYRFFPNPRGTMVAQTFTFAAASTARTGKLSMFFSSVQGILSTGGVLRPNEVRVTVGAITTTFTNELLSNDGQEWDTMTKLVNIPAGETQLTVVAVSGPGGDEDENTPDPKPASFAWNIAMLGIQCTGKIGDFVFKDANCDGNQAGDVGIPNVIVTLKQGNVVMATTTTDANGHYEFDGLCLGEYTVEVDATSLPAGLVPTPTCSNTPGIGDNSNCSPSPVVLTENNTEDLTIDFGYCEGNREIECSGKIGNFVWKDNDCDGTQEAGEPGIPGVTVQLLDCDGVNVLQTTTTDASGFYLFDSLCGGCYTVKVVVATLPAGYTPTTCSNVPGNGTNSNCSPTTVLLTENNEEDLTIDFGYCAPPECSGKIGNFVWQDLNCNGTQNAGEPGIANVVVKLYRGATLVKTTTTNASGYYSFDSLCADCYTVKVDATTLPAGYTATTCSNVANNNTNSNCSPAQVVLTTNSSQDLTIDFGYCAPSCCGKIGDRVWKDVDCDGNQDSGEPGIAGVTVKLYNGTTNALIATTTTNSTGYYQFTGLCAGCYTVKVESSTLPSGYTPTTCSNSSTSGTNSNCSPASVVLSGNSSTNLTIDFGYCPPPPCVPVTFVFCGSTSTCGTAGNIRTFTANGISVKVSAFSRYKSAATWNTAYLGLYSYGLGVTDNSEGDGSSNRHRVDNIDKNNYVLFEFSTPVTVTRAYLDAVITDSDISVWYGNFPSPYNNHLTLSDAVLGSMSNELDATGSSSPRWATFNGGEVQANVLVIAADVQDTSPEDWFKIRKLDITCPGGTSGGCEITVGGPVEEETPSSEITPSTYQLMQNFPNPFNPTTEISFELPALSATSLRIYNTLGQEIKTLVNADLDAGAYTYTWDATDNSGNRVASGVYFYHLRSGEFSTIKKMSLMK